MKPISNEVRKNIVEAKKRNEEMKNIVTWFDVSPTSVYAIWNQYKKTGSYEPKPFPGKQTSFTKEINDKIFEKVQKRPDITQEELIDELGLNITQAGLSKHMKKLGLTLKKRRLIRADNKSQK